MSHNFRAKRVNGFSLFVAERYEPLIDEAMLERLLAGACNCSSTQRKKRSFISVRRLPGGVQAHVKYWVPRFSKHRLKTLWQPSKLETEGRQYMRFMRLGLPVPELILWGYRRFPTSHLGVYMTGLIVTRTLEGMDDLRTLARLGRPPWLVGGRHCERDVMAELARMLVQLHRRGLVHGDYMLKNCMYAPSEQRRRYWIVDLESGWPLPPEDPTDGRGRYRDLLRMVLSLARQGFSREDALFFLESYIRQWQGRSDTRQKAEQCLEFCLHMPDRRAAETAAMLSGNAPQGTRYRPRRPNRNNRRTRP